jgi:hypothetical protein
MLTKVKRQAHNFKDLTGQRFEHLTVIERVEDHVTKGGNRLVAYKCRCDCGSEIIALSQKLLTGRMKSCGKCGVYKDLTSLIGRKFNHLTVIRRVEDHVSSGGNKFPAYECKCDCGNLKVVTAGNLQTNHVMSCGKCGIYDRKHDLTGQVFDKLTVICENGFYTYPNGERDYKWLCRCECGNYITIRGNSLKAEGNHNCGCYRNELRVKDEDMIGRRFGMLTVLERVAPVMSSVGTVVSRWRCACDCGCERIVKGAFLRNGRIVNCGNHSSNSVGEDLVCDYLKQYGFNYEQHVVFSDLRGVHDGCLSYDFIVYLNGRFVLIECQGIQHYEPVTFFGGREQFEIQQIHDDLKRMYVMRNNIPFCELDCRLEHRKFILDDLVNFLKNFESPK